MKLKDSSWREAQLAAHWKVRAQFKGKVLGVTQAQQLPKKDSRTIAQAMRAQKQKEKRDARLNKAA